MDELEQLTTAIANGEIDTANALFMGMMDAKRDALLGVVSKDVAKNAFRYVTTDELKAAAASEDVELDEDVENVDEISNDLRQSYRKKASADIEKHSRDTVSHHIDRNTQEKEKSRSKHIKRVKGIDASWKSEKSNEDTHPVLSAKEKLKEALDTLAKSRDVLKNEERPVYEKCDEPQKRYKKKAV